jgi:hypothetical protein
VKEQEEKRSFLVRLFVGLVVPGCIPRETGWRVRHERAGLTALRLERIEGARLEMTGEGRPERTGLLERTAGSLGERVVVLVHLERRALWVHRDMRGMPRLERAGRWPHLESWEVRRVVVVPRFESQVERD